MQTMIVVMELPLREDLRILVREELRKGMWVWDLWESR
jgi:hypothetical protein